ncbi:MAG: outer membrane beta-barrel protein [Rhodospirillaceae bacterium]|nr:outer membrane beta-barrel protein [Rhodospirillaceae bacterium]
MFLALASGRRALRLALFFAPLYAGVAAGAEDSASTTQVYDRAFVERDGTVTAEDMVRRVPGTGPILDGLDSRQQQRGFGSAGDQVLLDGKRFAGKGQILSALKRIQSANVARIELIRGNDADASVQSEGLIINIVLIEGAATSSGSGSWNVALKPTDYGVVDADAGVSYSNSAGALDYIVSVQRAAWNRGYPYWRDLTKTEHYYFPDGALRELRIDHAHYWQNQYDIAANLTYNLESGDRLRLNATLQPRFGRNSNDVAVTRYTTAGAVETTGTEIKRGRSGWQNQWEIGGDYEARIGAATRLNVLFIHSYEQDPGAEFRSFVSGAAVTELGRNARIPTNVESIVRGSLAFPLARGQTLELGGEIARNMSKQHLRPFFDLDGDGRVEEVTIPTAMSRVQEIRGETFATHTWQIAQGLSLSSAMVVEASRISNNFPGMPPHTYVYPKPRADLRYDITAQDQLRLKIDRRVSQLDFGLFVPKFDIVDNEIDAGNPNIRPEREWQFEAGYQRQLPGDQGLIEARAFYNRIEDHIDMFLLRVEQPGNIRVSSMGNIGAARHYGAEIKASVRMGVLGLPDLTLNGRLLRQGSKVKDPFTGRERGVPYSQAHQDLFPTELQLGFRHDVTSWGFTYGANYHERSGERLFSDIRVQRTVAAGQRLDAFAEKKLTGGLTLRLEGYGLMPQRYREYQRRVVYADDVIAGTVSRREDFTARWDRIFVISLRGTF